MSHYKKGRAYIKKNDSETSILAVNEDIKGDRWIIPEIQFDEHDKTITDSLKAELGITPDHIQEIQKNEKKRGQYEIHVKVKNKASTILPENSKYEGSLFLPSKHAESLLQNEKTLKKLLSPGKNSKTGKT